MTVDEESAADLAAYITSDQAHTGFSKGLKSLFDVLRADSPITLEHRSSASNDGREMLHIVSWDFHSANQMRHRGICVARETKVRLLVLVWKKYMRQRADTFLRPNHSDPQA